MKVLVLAPEPVDADALRTALGDEADAVADAEVLVVSPALHESPLRFWMSDADAAIARAGEVARASTETLRDEGVDATADTGESDPLVAIEDALRTFAADRIVVFVHPRDERRYREDDVCGEAGRRFGAPVVERVL